MNFHKGFEIQRAYKKSGSKHTYGCTKTIRIPPSRYGIGIKTTKTGLSHQVIITLHNSTSDIGLVKLFCKKEKKNKTEIRRSPNIWIKKFLLGNLHFLWFQSLKANTLHNILMKLGQKKKSLKFWQFSNFFSLNQSN